MPLRTAVVSTAIDDVEAVIVHDAPSVQLIEFIEIVGLTRSAFVTRPVAANDPVITGAGIVSPLGNVEDILGAPAPDVTSTPLLAALVIWRTAAPS